jgi:hypothetical protein
LLVPNRHFPPDFKDETGNAVPFGEMLAAEIRYRAAGDGSFLLPGGRIVKGAGIRVGHQGSEIA